MGMKFNKKEYRQKKQRKEKNIIKWTKRLKFLLSE
jgi:hypothetical protein